MTVWNSGTPIYVLYSILLPLSRFANQVSFCSLAYPEEQRPPVSIDTEKCDTEYPVERGLPLYPAEIPDLSSAIYGQGRSTS